MGEITEKRMRHYVGTDADKASIPVGGKSPGDSYHANDKSKQYYWNGTAWKTGLGYEFVNRLTNAIDVTEAVLVTDGTWKIDGLDLSGIVPAEAVAVLLHLVVQDDAASSEFSIRKDATHTENHMAVTTQVANITVRENAIIAINANRLLDYNGSNLAFTAIQITVLGWFI